MTKATSLDMLGPGGRSTDWEEFARALDGITVISDPRVVGVKSKDAYWYSPILKPLLDDKVGDVVVTPKDDAEVLRVAKACVERRVPLTVRGAGTGNYGQAIPLYGGVILDTTLIKEVTWLRPGMARVQAGLKMMHLDTEARKSGWEIRLFPSTKRTATIGGFIAGGSAGVGSINYGLLGERGNVNALRVVTLEDEPRVIELRGDDVQKASHAYGSNGIITELEIPLSPAYPWIDLIVAFDDFMAAVRFSQALGEASGIVRKLASIIAWPIPQYFTRLAPPVPSGADTVFTMVAEQSLEAFDCLVNEYGGRICYRQPAEDVSTTVPLYEYTWNHTTLHAIRADPTITYLQSMFPAGRNLELVEHMYHHFGDEVPMHLECIRLGGKITHTALQLVRFTTEERLNEIIEYHEAHGVTIFNPHTYILEDGGMKTIDENQLAFKRIVDPYGLMNPGKMRGWWEQPTP
ncbi:MAG: FAD-binding oxidoreductase [Armatimonadota bacterium]